MRKQLAILFAAAALLTAASLTAQDDADLFSKLDANKDGFVTSDEVSEPQKALFERLLRNADKDGDKKLSKEEFQAGLKPDEAPKQPLAGGPALPGRPGGGQFNPRELFSRFDANKDGKLTKDELPQRLQENFTRLDANRDGSVSEEEFGRGGAALGQRPPGAPGNPAAGGDARRAEEMFAQADANKDGKLTKDELPEDRRETFSQMVQRLNPGGDSLTKEQFVRGMMFMAQGAGTPPPGGRPNPGNAPDRGQLEALFDRTDANSDGKLTKDEIPEERQGMRSILERAGGESISKEQFVRGMMAFSQAGGQPPRPDGAPPRRPEGPPGAPPGGGLFAALDADRNGELSTSEIVGAGTALLKLDRNGDGKLTPDEVFGGGPPPGRPGEGQPPAAAPGQRRPGQRGLGGVNPEEFRERLKEADANKDGKISKDEAPQLLKERFDRVDTNGDGFVDEAEVRQMLQRMREAGGNPSGRRPASDQPRRPDNDKK